jgi:chromosome partitioning protein
VLSELRAKFRDYLMESTVNFNTKLKEAASFGQPITEYDPGSRGYKDFVNLARELMGHRPVDVEPVNNEKLSRPAELVQRAKQLAQLTNAQFGRGTVLFSGGSQPASAPAGRMGAPAMPPAGGSPAFAGMSSESEFSSASASAVAVAEPSVATAVAPRVADPRSTQQKIEDFYGVKQFGDEVIFAARFERASKVLIAGDFNGWSSVASPLQNLNGHGAWTIRLPLQPGRYRYRFIVDGRWVTDPHNTYVETNQFGELNNIVEVA